MLFTNVLTFNFYVPISKHVTVVSCPFVSTNTPTQHQRVMKKVNIPSLFLTLEEVSFSPIGLALRVSWFSFEIEVYQNKELSIGFYK